MRTGAAVGQTLRAGGRGLGRGAGLGARWAATVAEWCSLRGRTPQQRRFGWVAVVFALVAALVVTKLVGLQVLSPDRHRELAENQRFRVQPILGSRGAIKDRNGVDMAISVPLQTITADPSLVKNPDKAAAIIAETIPGVDQADMTERLDTRGKRFAYVARQVQPAQAAKLLKRLGAADIEGFSVSEEQLRMQTAKNVGSGVLGEVDIDGIGTAGVEKLMDDQLQGIPGTMLFERAQDGSTIANSERVTARAQPGSDVELTLDRDLQFEVEQALVSGVEATSAKSGVAVIGDPRTGELLAIANASRDKSDGKVRATTYNMAFAMAVEPGSVIKMVTAAAAYNEKLVDPAEVLTVPWSMRVGDHDYTDHDPHPTEAMRVDDILSKSSNIGTIMLAKRVGKPKMEDYLRAFGFGSRSPVEFPNESTGILRSAKDWADTDFASNAIGQGIAVTPIQLWAAYNVIANRGTYVPPKLVRSIDAPGAARHEVAAGDTRRVLNASAAQWVSRGLQAVTETGTAAGIGIPGYSMAGKTGTAYKPNPEGGYEWANGKRYTATFSGFLPASNPEVSITVIIDEPTAAHTGASAAAPVFENVAEIAIRRLGIRQDLVGSAADDGVEAPVRATTAVADPNVDEVLDDSTDDAADDASSDDTASQDASQGADTAATDADDSAGGASGGTGATGIAEAVFGATRSAAENDGG